ncbi:MAG: hypothetical protein M1838_003021 [Thelocarpon superellum]|nr:MAG: hypothetical protein M1838_003021 [Thelocarpon superellum]
MPTLADRKSVAIYMAAMSPKMQWLCGIVYDHYLRDGKKLLIFLDWPVNTWFVACFPTKIGIPTLDIRSCRSLPQRDATARLFNDPKDGNFILVTSLRTTSMTFAPRT